MKKITNLLIIFFIILFIPLRANADSGYTVDNYDIDIKVNENNVVQVTEEININYQTPSHGFVRTIPLTNNYYDKDNNKYLTISKFELLESNSNYEISKKNNIVSLKLGDKDNLIRGNKTYLISYTLDIGEDHIKDYDKFYFNIVGYDWDTKIKNVSFKIEMPKDFDEDKVLFLCNKEIEYNINNNIITGNIKKANILKENEGLTIKIDLPEDYYINTRNTINLEPFNIIKDNLLYIIVFLYSLVMLIIGLVTYIKNFYLSKKLIIPNFEIPEEDPAEIGLLYKRKGNKKQIISLIIYCVNKGYFDVYKKQDKIYIEKLKDFEKDEKIYIKCAFYNSFNENNIVELEKFKINIQTALAALESSYDYSDKNIKDSIKIIGLLLYASFILSIGISLSIHNIVLKLVLLFIGILSLIIGILLRNRPRKFDSKTYERYLKIAGLKEYLEKVEKDKLELLINDNPQAFYDILPYAYVLNISDKWIKMFTNAELFKLTFMDKIMLLDILDIDKKVIEERQNINLELFINSLNSSSSNDTDYSKSDSKPTSNNSRGSGGGGGHRW